MLRNEKFNNRWIRKNEFITTSAVALAAPVKDETVNNKGAVMIRGRGRAGWEAL